MIHNANPCQLPRRVACREYRERENRPANESPFAPTHAWQPAEGWLVGWGLQGDRGGESCTVAMVELDDGQVITCPPSSVRFLDPLGKPHIVGEEFTTRTFRVPSYNSEPKKVEPI